MIWLSAGIGMNDELEIELGDDKRAFYGRQRVV